MKVVIGIDPGIRACGVAIFVDDQLHRADLVRNPVHEGKDAAACVAMSLAVYDWLTRTVLLTNSVTSSATSSSNALVVEWPRILSASRQKAEKRDVDPNDLLALVGVDCALAMALREFATVHTRFPDEWKGQVPKAVMNSRVWERLSPEEHKNVLKKDHNVLDACGLAMHYLGRLQRHRFYA